MTPIPVSFARFCLDAAALGLLLPFIGCARTEAIPVYPTLSAPQALQVLADRAHAIKTVSAQAGVTLTRDSGQSIRLDAAIVMLPPRWARLRAYKFGQVVFDVTLTPDGFWLLASQGDRRDETFAAGSHAGDLTREWLGLMTSLFDDPSVTARESGAHIVVRQLRRDGTSVICQVNRKTLTVRRYTLHDRSGRERFTLNLGDYATFGAVVWPLRIEAISDSGRVLIELRDVEINAELPPNAFRPPARAEKLP